MLGYHRSEVAAILVGELALLVVLAIPLGCVVGVGLGELMTAMFSSELFRIPFAPARSTYGVAIIAVLAAAAAATCALVARRVLALDLVRVPVGALFRGPEGKWQVFVIDAGGARLRTVTIGQINEDWDEVRGGLDEGHRVVLNPANTRREGQRVRPR